MKSRTGGGKLRMDANDDTRKCCLHDKVEDCRSRLCLEEREKHALAVYLNFRSANKKLQRLVALDLKRYGLTDAKFGVLRAFEDRESCTMSEIVPWVLVGNSGITGIIDRMERDGLVTRTGGVKDARERHVRLTPKGRQLLDESLLPHRMYVAFLTESLLCDEEVENAESLLARLNDGLDKLIAEESERPRSHKRTPQKGGNLDAE